MEDAQSDISAEGFDIQQQQNKQQQAFLMNGLTALLYHPTANPP